jgi:hypothetical protein
MVHKTAQSHDTSHTGFCSHPPYYDAQHLPLPLYKMAYPKPSSLPYSRDLPSLASSSLSSSSSGAGFLLGTSDGVSTVSGLIVPTVDTNIGSQTARRGTWIANLTSDPALQNIIGSQIKLKDLICSITGLASSSCYNGSATCSNTYFGSQTPQCGSGDRCIKTWYGGFLYSPKPRQVSSEHCMAGSFPFLYSKQPYQSLQPPGHHHK